MNTLMMKLRRLSMALVLVTALSGIGLVRDEEPAAAYCAGVVWRRSTYLWNATEWIDVTNRCGRIYNYQVWLRCGMWEWYDSRVQYGCF